jgi:alpha-N-acetylglucosaminidase
LLQQSLRTGTEPDLKQFEETIRQWEWKWVNTQKDFPVVPVGSSILVTKMLYKKYRREMEEMK